MKILKRGVHPNEKIYRATCYTCETEVEFKRTEAKVRQDRNDSYLAVVCPVCSGSITTVP